MFSKSIIFSAILVCCVLAQASVVICGAISENEDGDMVVTRKANGQKYIIGENTNLDDTPEVSEASGTTVCFQGELEPVETDDEKPAVVASAAPAPQAQKSLGPQDSKTTQRTVASVVETEPPILNVFNVWLPVEN